MISRSDALHQLWTGVAGLPRIDEAEAFESILDVLFPAGRQLIALDCPSGAGRVLLDDTEVMPMVSLGDVVAEEFDLTLPYGTLLVFVSREDLSEDAPSERRAAALGRTCAQIVSETLYRGAFPFDRESQIAGALAADILRRARSIAFGGMSARAAFERELGRELRDEFGIDMTKADCRADASQGILDGVDAQLARPGRPAEAPNFGEWLDAVHFVTCGTREAAGERAADCMSAFAGPQRSGLGFAWRSDD